MVFPSNDQDDDNNGNKDGDSNSNSDSDSDSDSNSDMNENVTTIKEEGADDTLDIACPECEEAPCLFLAHKESLVAFDEAETASFALEDQQPPNNIRRKKLYRQITLMINGGPLGAGVRRPLPNCCVKAIREMMPSETFMGFRAE